MNFIDVWICNVCKKVCFDGADGIGNDYGDFCKCGLGLVDNGFLLRCESYGILVCIVEKIYE